MAEYQLRSYVIRTSEMDAWIAEWRENVVPLRRRHGFRVEFAYCARDEDRFVWLLAYEGPLGFAHADRLYYDSPARKAVNPDPARHIARAESWMVENVTPSP